MATMSLYLVSLVLLQSSMLCFSRRTELTEFSWRQGGCSKTIEMEPNTDYVLSMDIFSGIGAAVDGDNSVDTCWVKFLIADAMDRFKYKICFERNVFHTFDDSVRIKYSWSLDAATHLASRKIQTLEICFQIVGNFIV